jgi:uncharacterized protein YhhL (DUF1145 family)
LSQRWTPPLRLQVSACSTFLMMCHGPSMAVFVLLLLLSSFLITGFLSSLVLLPLSQWWTPPLRLQVSACSTFLMMCHVLSMAVFVGNLLSVVLVLFPDIFVNFAYNSGGPNDYWYDKAFHVPHSLNFYT